MEDAINPISSGSFTATPHFGPRWGTQWTFTCTYLPEWEMTLDCSMAEARRAVIDLQQKHRGGK